MEFLDKVRLLLLKAKDVAKRSNERRIVVLASSENINSLFQILQLGVRKKESTLLVHDRDKLGCELEEFFRKNLRGKAISFNKSSKVLGLTFENLIADLRHNLNPDDVGRLCGVVRGGGLIFFILPSLSKVDEWKTRFDEELVAYPLTLSDIKGNFEKRFLEKLLSSKACLVLDLENERVVKELGKTRIRKFRERKISFPSGSEIPRRLYRICLTQEQVRVLSSLEEFWKRGEKCAFVLKANRGRGKSASIGIFLSFLVWYFNKIGKQLTIGVTAPERENVEIVFKFLRIGIRKFGIRFKELEDALEIARGRIRIEYRRPVRLAEGYYDLVVVDEAAGIPIPFLYKIIKKYRKTVFSSTIHGYEGAGRGFSIRFLKGIKEEKLAKVFELQMEEPIRYARGDLVEEWLFDTLFLDAEPCKLERDDLVDIALKKLKFERIEEDRWFHEVEDEVKNFFGIYILAHYRNRPKDVALLVNSPSHFPRCVKTWKGKIINSIHLAKEGGLSKEIIRGVFEREKPKGHVVPLVVCRHYRNLEFGFLRGWRIVRIATHPEVMGKGIGSFALEEIEREAKENKLDWIGVSFGATPKLLRFWVRNNFIPLHISLERNTISGEYSVILVKPLSERARKIVEELNYEFRLRLLGSLMDVHFDIEHEIPWFLLKSFFKQKPHFSLNFTRNQKERMKAFLEETLPYESVAEVCRELARYYFLNTEKRPQLTQFQESLLILKSFLVKSWKRISILIGVESKIIIKRFRETMKKLWRFYVGG